MNTPLLKVLRIYILFKSTVIIFFLLLPCFSLTKYCTASLRITVCKSRAYETTSFVSVRMDLNVYIEDREKAWSGADSSLPFIAL